MPDWTPSLQQIIGTIISAFVIMGGGALFGYGKKRLERQLSSYRYIAFGAGILVATVAISNVVVELPWWAIAAAMLLASLLWGRDQWQYRRIGLLGVDVTPSRGIGYSKSLELCKDGLDFLGVGANKLTTQRDAFTAAIDRCDREDRPMRFLLCHPDNPEIERMERRAEKPLGTYRRLITESLSRLVAERAERGKNLEIRTYSTGTPLFRLMFINDRLLLVSHYVFGEDDGSNLPQMRVRRYLTGMRDNMGLYYPMRQYFQEFWDRSDPWVMPEEDMAGE